MAAPRPPLWLRQPTRYAALPKARARQVWIALALLMLFALSVLILPQPAAHPSVSGDTTDIALYDSIIQGIRHGGDYYITASDALRAGNYPLRPFLTFRLPTLAVVLAALPDWRTSALLYLLAAAVALAWFVRLQEAFPRKPPRIIALALFGAGMLVFIQSDLAPFHEIWAAQLIALSLALRRPGRWVEAVAIGMIAMLIRETAALYVLAMAALAWFEGQRREAWGWAGILAVFMVVLGAHAWAVSGVTGPLDAASPGWLGFNGFGLFVRSVTLATALQMLPLWIAALLVPLAMFGWSSFDDPLGVRVTVTLGVYALAIMLFARLDTFYWGLMAAPLLLVGLAFVPDAMRDLAAATLDRRRVRVQRISR